MISKYAVLREIARFGVGGGWMTFGNVDDLVDLYEDDLVEIVAIGPHETALVRATTRGLGVLCLIYGGR